MRIPIKLLPPGRYRLFPTGASFSCHPFELHPLPLLCPQASTDLVSAVLYLIVHEFHINRMMWRIVFRVWLPSLRFTRSSFEIHHATPRVFGSSLLVALGSCRVALLLTHLSAHRWAFAWFPLGSYFECSCYEHRRKSLSAHTGSLVLGRALVPKHLGYVESQYMFNFLRNRPTVFPGGCTIFCSCWGCLTRRSLPFLANTWSSAFLTLAVPRASARVSFPWRLLVPNILPGFIFSGETSAQGFAYFILGCPFISKL